jgi:hypothetical protein
VLQVRNPHGHLIVCGDPAFEPGAMDTKFKLHKLKDIDRLYIANVLKDMDINP